MSKEEAYNIWKNMKVADQMAILKVIPKKRTLQEKQIACILHIQKNSDQYSKAS